MGIRSQDGREDWQDDWRPHWPSSKRLNSLPALEAALAGTARDPGSFRAVVDEDLAEELGRISDEPSGIAFDDAHGRELDAQIRKKRTYAARQFYAELYRRGANDYLAALAAHSRPPEPTLGFDDVVDAAQAMSVWTGLAVGSGVLGNAAYDLLTRVTRSYRERRENVKRVEEAEYSAERGQRFFLSVLTPLTLEEARAVAYLSACAAVRGQDMRARTPDLDSVSVLRHAVLECGEHGNQVRSSCDQCRGAGWRLILAFDERLFRIWIPRGDPLSTTVRVETVW